MKSMRYLTERGYGFLLALVLLICVAAGTVPLLNPVLQSNMDGGGYAITNLSGVVSQDAIDNTVWLSDGSYAVNAYKHNDGSGAGYFSDGNGNKVLMADGTNALKVTGSTTIAATASRATAAGSAPTASTGAA